MACRMKENDNVIGYVEIPEDYWEYSYNVEYEVIESN